MPEEKLPGWQFIDDNGTFELTDPHRTSYLYFPLVNEAGMMSSITPVLHGDAKRDQNTFLLLPVSVEDLHNSHSSRNFWVRINGEPWSATGYSAAQHRFDPTSTEQVVTLRAGFQWHSVERQHPGTGLWASAINFVPFEQDTVELMQITLENRGETTLELDPIAAIPMYGRSADNIRDHRHVTALLHRTTCHPFGVLLKPIMSFDERGHQPNHTLYIVLGMDDLGAPPRGFTPLVEDFIGEGGSLAWPQAVVSEGPDLSPPDSTYEGYETIGGLHFERVCLSPGESRRYQLILGILEEDADVEALLSRYGSAEKFASHLAQNQATWQGKLSTLGFDHQHKRRDGWLQWVTLQPTLRRIMGNSFLPYHDYGRGGRGWRDLWQDLLALLLTEGAVDERILLGNFAGMRMDGSNATILGSAPGEFKADRNNIPRVWMDHAAWPLLTTKLYLDLSGNIRFLLEPQTYFKDHLTHRAQQVDPLWDSSEGTQLKSVSGDVIEGTVLEHLLVGHLTAFFNVGEHNFIRLEGGDWNDAFDMASERGESVAFSALYAGNLRLLGELCLALVQAGVDTVSLAKELVPLLDRVSEQVDYNSIVAKQALLGAYFDQVGRQLSGERVKLSLEKMAVDLFQKADWLAQHIRQSEWLSGQQTERGWFNGYYDNHGQRVEGVGEQGVRMTLTGQVFPLMAGIVSEAQAGAVVRAVDAYLYDPQCHGYRLNTDFGDDPPALGRAFGFAYGHKENGAIFSHMAVMYAYALYRQGLAEAAWRVLDGLYQQSQDFAQSRIYPGIPEYFNPRGRGMYPYLTGSAAWYLFALLTEAFGVKGDLGDLHLEPKLVQSQFDHGDRIKVHTGFAGKKLDVVYHNPHRLSYGDYGLGQVSVNGKEQPILTGQKTIKFPRVDVETWPERTHILIDLIPLKASSADKLVDG